MVLRDWHSYLLQYDVLCSVASNRVCLHVVFVHAIQVHRLAQILAKWSLQNTVKDFTRIQEDLSRPRFLSSLEVLGHRECRTSVFYFWCGYPSSVSDGSSDIADPLHIRKTSSGLLFQEATLIWLDYQQDNHELSVRWSIHILHHGSMGILQLVGL